MTIKDKKRKSYESNVSAVVGSWDTWVRRHLHRQFGRCRRARTQSGDVNSRRN
ncbi:hypothetical protein VDIAB_270705 [Vibrio diabolicus]|nr:hypothetical protein VDIAB_270705 [Vibrio diabolicus]